MENCLLRRKKNFSNMICLLMAIYYCFLFSAVSCLEKRGINFPLLYTPKKGWINDPNGLVYADGIYHLFYQYSIYGDQPNNISWGHAVSRDLVAWTDKGNALPYNETTKEMIFSGSAVYDKNNTSGFGTASNPPLVAIYTSFYSAGITLSDGTVLKTGTQAQSIAYSIDKGESWHYYHANPVIRSPPKQYADQFKEFRDPKVFWYPPQNKWVMVNVLSNLKKALFYSSNNLKEWTFMGEFSSKNTPDNIWECPDLFELKVPGNESKWVLLMSTNPGGVAGGSGMHYYIGDFNGYNFTEEYKDSGIKWLDFGSDFYAGVTWNNVDRGRFLIGWINNWEYGPKNGPNLYKGGLGFVRELSLKYIDGRVKLIQAPYKDLYNYKKGESRHELDSADQEVDSARNGIHISKGNAYELEVKIFNVKKTGFTFRLENEKNDLEAEIQYQEKSISIKKKSNNPDDAGKYVTHVAPYKINSTEALQIFIDSDSLTLFNGNGDISFTELVFSDSKIRRFYLSQGSNIQVRVTKLFFSRNAGKSGILEAITSFIASIADWIWNTL